MKLKKATKTNKKKTFSALGFILVTIGCAVGLGNIWRFPREVVANGGSSFIIIYLIVLLIVVFPILLLEMQYGLFYRRNPVACFDKVANKPGRFLGWMQIFATGFVCFYYLILVAWVLVSLFSSVVPSLFGQLSNLDENFFDTEILKKSTDIQINATEPIKSSFSLSFSHWIFIAAIVILFFSCLVLYFGTGGLEKTNMILVPFLFLILIGLLVYVIFFLQNSHSGLDVLFKFEPKKFININIWFSALKQAIFSTGILYGCFIIFSKNSDIKVDKGNDAIIIISADTLIGIISGVIVTGVISYQKGTEIDVQGKSIMEIHEEIKSQVQVFFNDPNSGGSTLVFRYFPSLFQEINNIPAFASLNMPRNFGIGTILYILFLLALLFAAFSSLIALMSVFIFSISETFRVRQTKVIFYFALLAMFISIFYSTSLGPTLIDEQDAITLLVVMIVGVTEIFLFSFHSNFFHILRTNQEYSYLKLAPRRFPWFAIIIRFIAGPILFILVLYGFIQFFGIGHYLARLIPESLLNDGKFYNEFFENFKNDMKPLQFTLSKIASCFVFVLLIGFAGLFTFAAKSSEADVDENIVLPNHSQTTKKPILVKKVIKKN